MADDDSTSCIPRIDWSPCDDDNGFPAVLPVFYLVSAMTFGAAGVLFVQSLVKTLRMQLREKKKLNYNTAVQMHVGIILYSITGVCHHAVSGVTHTGTTNHVRIPQLLHWCAAYMMFSEHDLWDGGFFLASLQILSARVVCYQIMWVI